MVAYAAARARKVIVLDALTYAGDKANLEGISGDWTLVEGDINNRPLVLKLLREHRVTSVIHLAAESHVDNSITGPECFIDTNIKGTFLLLEACREYWNGGAEGFRFLYVSTDEVYGALGISGKFSEASPTRPNSPYAASKAAGDHLVRAWHHTYGLPIIITHCSNNYGPRQHPEKFIPTMIRSALAGEALPVYGDGKHVRDWLHVEDHCAGLWLALEKGITGETYDFGGNCEIENIALVKMICAQLGEKYARQIAFVTDRPGHDRRYAIDFSKAKSELGFSPRQTFEQGLKETVQWYVAHQDWDAMMRGKR